MSSEQFSSASHIGFVGRASEQAVMPDAMKALRQNMEQEAAPDELVGRERHDALALFAVAAIPAIKGGSYGGFGFLDSACTMAHGETRGQAS